MNEIDERDDYNGWTNRETWAVSLWIDNERGLYEDVVSSLRESVDDNPDPDDGVTGMTEYAAGEIVRARVEGYLDAIWDALTYGPWPASGPFDAASARGMLDDIGSTWRVNWSEIGAAYLTHLAEASS